MLVRSAGLTRLPSTPLLIKYYYLVSPGLTIKMRPRAALPLPSVVPKPCLLVERSARSAPLCCYLELMAEHDARGALYESCQQQGGDKAGNSPMRLPRGDNHANRPKQLRAARHRRPNQAARAGA